MAKSVGRANAVARGKARNKPGNSFTSKGNNGSTLAFTAPGKRKHAPTSHGNSQQQQQPFQKRPRRSQFSVYEDDDADERTERRVLQRIDRETETDTTVNGNEAPLEIDEEDDEEISEDGAFDSEDEERFGVFFEGGKAGAGEEEEEEEGEMDDDVKDLFAGADDDDEDDEDDEDEDSEGEQEEESDTEVVKRGNKRAAASDEGSDDEMSGDDSSADDADSDFSGDDEEDPTLDSLASFVAGLDTATTSGKPRSARRRIQETTLPFPESPHALPIPDNAKPTLADLVASADIPGLSALRKQVAQLEKQRQKTGGPLAAPLPKRLQDRTLRQAAREATVKEVSKWTHLVKKNREAETLRFPLNEVKDNTTTASLAGNFNPSTDLEKEIAMALQASGADEAQLAKAEELEMNKITPEELLARKKELAKLRSLLFFQEAKLKKAAKIKSKAYRKIKKKEREANKERLRSELESMDPDAAAEAAKKADIDRARERVSLRHKNTGKWAREPKSGDREAVQESLRRHEQLVRRIQGRDSDDSSEEDEPSDAELDEEQDSDDARLKAHEELEALEASLDAEAPQKGLMALKFMQRAAAEEKDRVKKELQKMRDEIDDEDGEEKEEEEGRWEEVGSGRRKFDGKQGRMVSAPMMQQDEDIVAESNNRSQRSSKIRTDGPISISTENPWLKPVDHVQKSTKEGGPKTRQEKALANLSRERKSALKEREEDEDEMGIIEMGDLALPKRAAAVGKPAVAVEPSASGTKKEAEKGSLRPPVVVKGSDTDGDEDEEEGEAGPEMTHLSDLKAMSQRELMNLAFATDDVVADFEEEKRQLEESDEEEDDGVLPGWGSWGGKGVKKPKAKKKGDSKPKAEKPKRQDAHLKHVIINDKKPKKLLKYASEGVPFPYKTREQYEATLRMPLGKEWNTATAHQKNIVPSVVTKAGTIIHPLKVCVATFLALFFLSQLG